MRHSNFMVGLATLACLSFVQTAAADTTHILIETSLGNITIELDQQHAPQTVQNFLRYVSEKHFDGTIFYRVVPGFVIQGGSYTADGGYRSPHSGIPLEANNGLLNTRGSIAMARGDTPNSADAEFFIDLSDNTDLNHNPSDAGNTTGYTVFGHVSAGMDVVDQIAAVKLGDKGPFPGAAPVEPIVVRKISALP